MTQRRREERGAAAVEFALVMPILFMVLFGIIGFGMWFAQDLALNNSARQAARYGVVDNRSCADMITQARDSASTLAMDGHDTTHLTVAVKIGQTKASAASTCPTPTSTTQPCVGSVPGDNVYVTMVYTGSTPVPLVPVPDVITGEGVFRCEFS